MAKPHQEHHADLGLAEDETDAAADQSVMDRLRGLGAVGRAHAINEADPHRSPGLDLLPDF